MDRCKLMKGDLLHMKTSLAAGVSCRRVKKTFDGVGWAVEGTRAKVDRAINYPITAMAQDTHEFEGAIVDESADSWGTRKVTGRHAARNALQDLQEGYLGEGGGRDALRREKEKSKSRGDDARKD